MNEIIKKEKIAVENMIYEIRGKQVILDSEIFAIKFHRKAVSYE